MTKKKKPEYLYLACFIRQAEVNKITQRLGGQRLERVIANPHITLSFLPAKSHVEFFGRVMGFRVIGYANDGRNEGVLVEPDYICDALKSLINERPTHHITLSLSDDGRAVDTGNLEFTPVDPIPIEGVFGGCTHAGTIVLAPGQINPKWSN